MTTKYCPNCRKNQETGTVSLKGSDNATTKTRNLHNNMVSSLVENDDLKIFYFVRRVKCNVCKHSWKTVEVNYSNLLKVIDSFEHYYKQYQAEKSFHQEFKKELIETTDQLNKIIADIEDSSTEAIMELTSVIEDHIQKVNDSQQEILDLQKEKEGYKAEIKTHQENIMTLVSRVESLKTQVRNVGNDSEKTLKERIEYLENELKIKEDRYVASLEAAQAEVRIPLCKKIGELNTILEKQTELINEYKILKRAISVMESYSL